LSVFISASLITERATVSLKQGLSCSTPHCLFISQKSLSYGWLFSCETFS